MFKKCLLLIALPALLIPTLALAQDVVQDAAQDAAMGEAREIPFLIGTWKSTEASSVIRGPGTTHNPGHEGVTYSSLEMTLEITDQQGRVFEGRKISANNEEDFVGGIALDDTTVWFAEGEGVMTARLVSPTEMEVVYIHETADTDLVAVVRYEKQ